MNINFYAKNFDMGDEVKEYIEDKLNKFQKFSKDNIGADVKMERSKFQNNKDVFTCRIALSIDGKDFTAEKTGSTTFEVIDNVEDALENIILKDKDQRISSKRVKNIDEKIDLSDLNID